MRHSPSSQMQIARALNGRKQDLRGLPHESAAEFLSRGGHVEKTPYRYKAEPGRAAFPKRPIREGGYQGRTRNNQPIVLLDEGET